MQSKLPASACTIPALQPELQSVSSTRPLSVCHSFFDVPAARSHECSDQISIYEAAVSAQVHWLRRSQKMSPMLPKAVIHFLSISKPYSYSCLFFKTNSKRESTCIECEPFKSTMSCDCRRLSKSLAASSRPAHQYALPPKASTAAAIAFASSP